jgi:hypothetical protein
MVRGDRGPAPCARRRRDDAQRRARGIGRDRRRAQARARARKSACIRINRGRLLRVESNMPSHAVVSPTGGPMRLRARRLVRRFVRVASMSLPTLRGSGGTFICVEHSPAILSPAKRTALIACLKGGGTLHQRYGVWGSEVVGVRSRCCRAFNLKEGERKRLLVREAGLDGR